MPMDKIQELEEKLDRLELKTKASFLEVEKRLKEVPEHVQLPGDIDERFNELEDLILLMQVETSKIKDRITGGLGFGAEVDTAAINERMGSIEERISEISTNREESSIPGDIMEKINTIDQHSSSINEILERLDRLGTGRRIAETKHMPKIVSEPIEEEEIVMPSKSLLSEVNKILEGG